MSSALVSHRHLTVIVLWAHAQGLTQSPTALLRSLRATNGAAFKARYSSTGRLPALIRGPLLTCVTAPAQALLDGLDGEAPRAALALALLESLQYQCDEGDVPNTAGYRRIEKLRAAAAALAPAGKPMVGVWLI